MRRVHVRVGTRGSALALAQTEWVVARVQAASPETCFEIVTIRTEGDRDRVTPLPEMGGRGVFVGEVERHLAEKRIDLAVHSLKDLPTAEAEGLVIAAIPVREDPHDGLVSRLGVSLDELPPGAVVGTGSLRRQAQLASHRDDLHFELIRGNIETRIHQVMEGRYDAIVLAIAGLRRGAVQAPVWPIPFDIMLPSAGQGALALQCRAGDDAVIALARAIEDDEARGASRAERGILARLRGGCHAPVGAYCVRSGGMWRLDVCVARPDGSQSVRLTVVGEDPEGLAEIAYERLSAQGATKILAADSVGSPEP